MEMPREPKYGMSKTAVSISAHVNRGYNYTKSATVQPPLVCVALLNIKYYNFRPVAVTAGLVRLCETQHCIYTVGIVLQAIRIFLVESWCACAGKVGGGREEKYVW